MRSVALQLQEARAKASGAFPMRSSAATHESPNNQLFPRALDDIQGNKPLVCLVHPSPVPSLRPQVEMHSRGSFSQPARYGAPL
jgi:hypothetical protein